jgi:deoxyribodipyrimidine photolyase
MHTVVWFRKGLRLHDNPALLEAVDGGSRVMPVFVLDPHFLKPQNVGANRTNFLLQSLADLDASLRARSSRLIVLHGATAPWLWQLCAATCTHNPSCRQAGGGAAPGAARLGRQASVLRVVRGWRRGGLRSARS